MPPAFERRSSRRSIRRRTASSVPCLAIDLTSRVTLDGEPHLRVHDFRMTFLRAILSSLAGHGRHHLPLSPPARLDHARRARQAARRIDPRHGVGGSAAGAAAVGLSVRLHGRLPVPVPGIQPHRLRALRVLRPGAVSRIHGGADDRRVVDQAEHSPREERDAADRADSRPQRHRRHGEPVREHRRSSCCSSPANRIAQLARPLAARRRRAAGDVARSASRGCCRASRWRCRTSRTSSTCSSSC